MKNKFEIRGNKVTIFLNRRDGDVLEAIIDLSDMAKVQEHTGRWHAGWDKVTKSFYVCGKSPIRGGKGTTVHLHRWIMDTPPDLQVDHRDHNTLNNTRNNLRNVTNSVNQQNRKRLDINNTSGARGVCWDKSAKKWRARLRINGKRIHLGLFTDMQLASNFAHEARVRLMPGYIY